MTDEEKDKNIDVDYFIPIALETWPEWNLVLWVSDNCPSCGGPTMGVVVGYTGGRTVGRVCVNPKTTGCLG